jgi:hypothetical protein
VICSIDIHGGVSVQAVLPAVAQYRGMLQLFPGRVGPERSQLWISDETFLQREVAVGEELRRMHFGG